MQRALSLAWHYVRLAVMNELQYRLNFLSSYSNQPSPW
jgi:ABC-type uncharacterized transport system permease subunit